MAVGEGNYGRLGPDQQQRFTTANRRLQLPDPDEQPGAMPEIAPSPLYGRSVEKKFTERASVLQAWGAYGTAWPVVHQQLGVRPDLGRGRLEVVPQPPGARADRRLEHPPRRLGQRRRQRAAHSGRTFTTTVTAHAPVRVRIGATLPAGAQRRPGPPGRAHGERGRARHEPRPRGHRPDVAGGGAHAGRDDALSGRRRRILSATTARPRSRRGARSRGRPPWRRRARGPRGRRGARGSRPATSPSRR